MSLAIHLGLSALSAELMGLSVPDVQSVAAHVDRPAARAARRAHGRDARAPFLHGWLPDRGQHGRVLLDKGLLERFGHMPAAEAIPFMMLLTTYQGLEFGLWSWGVHRLALRRPGVSLALLAPLVMVAIELVVPQMFPFYLAISQAWVPPVIQIADLTGPMGVSFVLVMATGMYERSRCLVAGADRRRVPLRHRPGRRTRL